jgi:hypothetical protein
VTDEERAVAFLRETYRRRVEQVEAFPWGELVVTPSLARVYDANFALVSSWEGTAGELESEMDRIQAAAGFAHIARRSSPTGLSPSRSGMRSSDRAGTSPVATC